MRATHSVAVSAVSVPLNAPIAIPGCRAGCEPGHARAPRENSLGGPWAVPIATTASPIRSVASLAGVMRNNRSHSSMASQRSSSGVRFHR